MQDVKHIIDGLKLRASYGTLGNQNLAGGDAASYYPTTQNLAMGQISMNDNIYSLVTLNTLANPDIKWETTTMLDVGVDFSLFNKLNITADWYRKETKDILMKLDMPLGIGLNAPYQNAGKVRNTGWEVSVGYNNQWRDFSFGVQANLSDVKNEILDMRGKTSTSGVLRNQEGYSIGSIYALMALGYTMVYGIAKMLNFAHGDIIMVGAYAVVTSVLTLGMPPLVAILISIAICALLGITVEFLAYRPLRQAPPLAVLITAIGVSYLLQNLALLIYGSEQKAFPVLFTIPSVELGGVYIDGITIATMAVTAIIMVGLSLFINRTRMGKAMRAVSEDKEAAELMGISVNRTITVTFAIGSALAGVAAIFYGAAYTYIRPTTGAMPGIKAFTAAVFGGIGSIPGAMLGGVLLGVIEQLSKTYISTLWADAIVFGVLVAVLVVKPTGLLGKRISEKV